MNYSFKGIIVPAITPYKADLSLDTNGMEKVLAYFDCHTALDGIFITGATGEYDMLTFEERKRIIDIVCGMSLNKAWLINTSTRKRASSLGLTAYAVSRGIGSVGVILPEECRTFDDVSSFLSDIHALGMDVFIYQTGSSPYPLSVEEMGLILELGGISGIKDSCSPRDMYRHIRYISDYGHRMTVIQGVEMLYLSSLAMGVHGVIGGGCNVYPQLLKRIHNAYYAGDTGSARRDQVLVNRLVEQLYDEGTGNESMKYFLSLCGVDIGWYSRKPSAAISDHKKNIMKKIYEFIAGLQTGCDKF